MLFHHSNHAGTPVHEVEREGDWILQPLYLERMLPYFVVAGHHQHARCIRTSSAAAAKRRVKPGVEGVAMDPMDYRVLATVSEGGMLAVTHLLNGRRPKATHNRVMWILIILRGKRVND